MNSNLDPTEVNVLNDIQRLIFEISQRYEEEKASRYVASILQRIAKGGSYRDVYNYCKTIKLGKIFQKTIDVHEFAANIEKYDELSRGFMLIANNYAKDITDMTELIQKSLYDSMGLKIKPKTVRPNQEALKTIINNMLDVLITGDTSDSPFGEFGAELLKWSSELIDSIIIANAELQIRSGFNIVVVRRYDDVGIHNYANYSDGRKATHAAQECPFCKEREGVFEYEETKKNNFVWQRHAGCSCSIDLVNKGMTERVKNYTY